MVRSAHFSPQSRQTPDPIRIVAIATAIAVNLSIFAVLMRPLSYTLPVERGDDLIAVPPTVKIEPLHQPPIVPVKKQPQAHPTPTHLARPAPPKDPVLSKTSTDMSTKPVDSLPTPPGPIGPVDVGPPQPPMEVSLVPIDSPAPSYPIDLLRNGVTGTVQLELLVGVDGRVIEVTVIHSSGNRELDNAAREQVQRNWRFKPATRDGVPVQARGLLPIAFNVDTR
jgi:periplasmic protein TonB